MARGKTFLQLVNDTKAEARQSLTPSLSQNALPYIKQTVARIYESLYASHEWPTLEIRRYENISAGMRYYSYPADMDFERTVKIYPRYNEEWMEKGLLYGIEVEHYNQYDPLQDERSDPPIRWAWHEGDQIEVWPLPATNLTNGLMFVGIKKFAPLVDDADLCLIDSNLVILYAAAEILASQKSTDAQAKQAKAQQLFDAMKAKQSKQRVVSLSGADEEPRDRIVTTYTRAG